MTFYLITMVQKTSNQRLVAVKSQRNMSAVINGVARLSAPPPSLDRSQTLHSTTCYILRNDGAILMTIWAGLLECSLYFVS